MVFTDNWASGVGVKSFGDLCEQFREEGLVRLCSTHPHNPYLDWMVVAGLPGLLLWCALALSLLLPGVKLLGGRATRTAALFGLSCLFMTFWPLQVSQSLFSNWPGLLAWTSLGMTYAAFFQLRVKKAQ
jgi:O-antigen ligase